LTWLNLPVDKQVVIGPPKPGDSIPSFDRIVRAIKSGLCIPFLGAGVSMAFKNWRDGQREIPGCPSGRELKDILDAAIRAKTPISPDLSRVPLVDLPSVAEFYEYIENGQRGEIEDLVRTAIKRAATPRPIHWALAAIPSVRCVYTTNYDQLVEQASKEISPARNLIGPFIYDQTKSEQQHPSEIPIEITTNQKFDWQAPKPADGHPLLLYKMHGCVTCSNSMLITTYDYVRHIATWHDERAGVPKEFRNLLLKNSILFLGYGLGDWNFRVIWEAMIGAFPGGRFPIQSFAIKNNVTDFERSLFALRNIALIECDLTLFARALAEAFNFTIPEVP
jgi:hypothetical protein